MLNVKRVVVLSMVMMGFVVSPLCHGAGEVAPEEMTGLKVGETVADFTLTDQNGEARSLESLLAKKGTTVLVFHRSALW